MPVNIFVINLERSADRREQILARLKQLGLEAEIFRAYEGAKLPDGGQRYHGRKRRLFFGKDLTLGEIGCAYSHLGVCALMLERGLSHALVLEDDAILYDHLPQAIKAALNCQGEWDVVRFMASDKVRRLARIIPADIGGGLMLARPFGTPGDACGYMLNAHAARNFLERAERLWLPIDVFYGQVWHNKLRSYVLLPSPVKNDFENGSTIGAARFGKAARPKGWEGIVYPFTRAAYKLWDTAMKRVSFYGGFFADRRMAKELNVRFKVE